MIKTHFYVFMQIIVKICIQYILLTAFYPENKGLRRVQQNMTVATKQDPGFLLHQ